MEPVRKRAFPAWLRRIDPFLAKEDENLLFQFFRERRARSGGWGWKVKGPFVGLLVYLAVVVFIRNTQILQILAIAGTVYVFLLAYLILRKRKGDGTSDFPRRIRDVLPSSEIDSLLVADIWMTGVDGRRIAVVAALEGAELWKRMAYLGAAVPFTFLFIFRDLALPLPHRLFLFGSGLLVTMPMSALMLYTVILAGAVSVDNLSDVCLKHVSYRRFLFKGFRQTVLVIGIGAPVMFLIFFAVINPIDHFLRALPSIGSPEMVDVEILATRLLFVGVALCIAVYPLIRWMRSWRQAVIKNAGPLFEEFFRKAIVGDDDA